jgi:hypothetical protein
MKYKLNLFMDDGGKKITAIKLWRSITGCGLTEGKEFIESSHMINVSVILNETQLAKLVCASVNEACGNKNSFMRASADDRKPHFRIVQCEAYKATGYDFSNLEPRYAA